jgi:ATP-dependent DNA helicase RecQ
MMRYAETLMCRTRFLRRYFGEPEGEDCSHCDNCRSGAAARYRDPEPRAETAPASPETGTAVPADSPAAAALRASPRAALFSIGEAVLHKKFGSGEVTELSGRNVVVRFTKVGRRTVRANFLRKTG